MSDQRKSCKYYLQGFCSQGSQCSFMHGNSTVTNSAFTGNVPNRARLYENAKNSNSEATNHRQSSARTIIKSTDKTNKLTTHSYICSTKKLTVADRSGFKAAGLLPFRFNERILSFEALFGVDFFDEVNLLGGKRDRKKNGLQESIFETGQREFYEETGGLLSEQDLNKTLMSESCDVMWLGHETHPPKFVLFLLNVDSLENGSFKADLMDLDLNFCKPEQIERRKSLPFCYQEMKLLRWIPINVVFSCDKYEFRFRNFLNNCVRRERILCDWFRDHLSIKPEVTTLDDSTISKMDTLSIA